MMMLCWKMMLMTTTLMIKANLLSLFNNKKTI
jgi:hypothetical protein